MLVSLPFLHDYLFRRDSHRFDHFDRSHLWLESEVCGYNSATGGHAYATHQHYGKARIGRM